MFGSSGAHLLWDVAQTTSMSRLRRRRSWSTRPPSACPRVLSWRCTPPPACAERRGRCLRGIRMLLYSEASYKHSFRVVRRMRAPSGHQYEHLCGTDVFKFCAHPSCAQCGIPRPRSKPPHKHLSGQRNRAGKFVCHCVSELRKKGWRRGGNARLFSPLVCFSVARAPRQALQERRDWQER